MKYIVTLVLMVAVVAPCEAGLFSKKKAGETDAELLKSALSKPGACSFKLAKGWHYTLPDQKRLEEIDDEALRQAVTESTILGAKGPGKGIDQATLAVNVMPCEMEQEEFTEMCREAMENLRLQVAGNVRCQPMGQVETKAGKAELTMMEMERSGGDVKMLQAVLVRDGQAYQVTTSAALSDFGERYSDFLEMIRSFSISEE